jgi:hypothetical protein
MVPRPPERSQARLRLLVIGGMAERKDKTELGSERVEAFSDAVFA